ncbi:hypothetical protein I4U23_018522 [Adineta vaga]|nr:hypothetical protein I4U23_018522 [Adineta vaga]
MADAKIDMALDDIIKKNRNGPGNRRGRGRGGNMMQRRGGNNQRGNRGGRIGKNNNFGNNNNRSRGGGNFRRGGGRNSFNQQNNNRSNNFRQQRGRGNTIPGFNRRNQGSDKPTATNVTALRRRMVAAQRALSRATKTLASIPRIRQQRQRILQQPQKLRNIITRNKLASAGAGAGGIRKRLGTGRKLTGRGGGARLYLLSSTKPIEIARKLSDQQIRSILPSLLWLGLQQCPKNHRLTISAQLLQIVSRFHDMDTIIELFEIDFHALNLEIKRLQKIKQKILEGGQQNSNALINQEIIAFEQATARDRCRIVAQILFDDNEKDQQLLINLLDESNHVRIVGDVLCVLILHLSHSFKFDILISNLLHSKYAYEYVIRLILNIPTLKLTFAELIIRCSANDDGRYHILRTLVKLYPIHKLHLLRLCHQRQTLLSLILDLLDHSTVNILLLILSNQKQRTWFKKCQTPELVHNLINKLFELYRQKQCSQHSILKITAILHVYCNVKFSSDEVQQLLALLLLPTMDVTLGLCYLFMIPSLVEHNEQRIIEWLIPTMSSLETDDKLLMIGLFCITNYNEPLNALASSTLDFPCRIDPGPFHHSRLLLIQRVFTNDLLVQRFATIQITLNLNATMTLKHLPAHFICYLLSKGLCNQHHVQMSPWVWSQILQCITPIHPIILTLINELVTTIVDARYTWYLAPIDIQTIHDYLVSSSSNDHISTKMLILLYLLTLNDQATGDIAIQYIQSARILFDLLPLPHLVEQLTTKDYDAIAPQLGRLMMEQLPQIFLADHALYLETDSQLISLHHVYKADMIESLVDQLKSTLVNGISRKQADEWRRGWFRVYAYRGQLLTLKTAQTLLENNQLTYDDLCADPHSLLRFSFQVYNYPSIVQIILFIMRELLIASRHHFERIIKAKQQQPTPSTDIIPLQEVKNNPLYEKLIHAQEALVIQILLDVLHEYKKTACLPAYRELQGVICSFVHQMFITNPELARHVHFQGYPSDQIKPLIYSVPSMHICLNFIPRMLETNELDTQIFAFELLTDLSSFYPIRTALLVVKLALQVYATLLRVLSNEDRLRFFSRTYKFLTHMSSTFPPLTQNSVYVLQQAIRACSLPPSNLPQLKWTSDSLGRPRRIDI